VYDATSAPRRVPVGPGRNRLHYSRLLHIQKNAVPLFIKLGTSKWQYRGRFRCDRYVTAPHQVRRLADPDGRRDAKAIMFLVPSGDAVPFDEADEMLEGNEGTLLLRMHRERERNPQLAKAKRAAATRTGTFLCEVCALDFREHANGLGHRCSEVHHLRPLAHLGPEKSVKTTLKDLALVCANCHRMLHAESPPLTIRALQNRIAMGA
jgi:hypothetical protein